MLVVENRHLPAVLAKDLHHLPKELVAGILLLLQFVARIIAVLADDEYRIDGELLAATAQRLGDGRMDAKAEFLGPFPAQVVLRRLIDVSGDDIECRPMP